MPVGPSEPAQFSNPLLAAVDAARATGELDEVLREELIVRYALAVPTDELLDCIARWSPSGVVEVGAGTGYWAAALHARGVPVSAHDLHPAPSEDNIWFAGSPQWHPVAEGDTTVVDGHGDRTLLLVWPTNDQTWPADALRRHHAVGGGCVAYVGEPPGGHTGDDVFHALLGDLRTCLQCDHGVLTAPCICDVVPQWRRVDSVELPHLPGCHDDLHVYLRREDPARAVGDRRRRWWQLRR